MKKEMLEAIFISQKLHGNEFNCVWYDHLEGSPYLHIVLKEMVLFLVF